MLWFVGSLKLQELERSLTKKRGCVMRVAVKTDAVVDNTAKYFEEISKHSLLTEEERSDLFRRLKLGDKQAFEILVSANLRLVASMANKFLKYETHLKLDDYIQEGNFGLMVAIKKFDYQLGYKFSTYAKWWIQAYILKALYSKNRLIYIPPGAFANLSALRKARKKLWRTSGYEPSMAEIARYMGIEEEDLLEIITSTQCVTSLNTPLSGEEDSDEFGNMQEDTTVRPPEKLVEDSDLAKKVHAEIKLILSKEDRDIFFLKMSGDTSDNDIAWRYGMSINELGKAFQTILIRLRASKELRSLV
jgi:RNA polymerase primary sigma factor